MVHGYRFSKEDYKGGNLWRSEIKVRTERAPDVNPVGQLKPEESEAEKKRKLDKEKNEEGQTAKHKKIKLKW